MQRDDHAGLDDREWARLARYVAGESSPAEVAEVSRWLAGDPARDEVLAELRAAWSAAGAERAPVTDVNGAWTAMAARVAAWDAGVPVPAGSRAAGGADSSGRARRRFAMAPALGMAAAVVFFAGALAWQSRRGAGVNRAAAVLAAARTYTTAPGERRSIMLDDGTEVMLGVSSALTAAAGYGGSARELSLVGEALFRVRHDVARPFRVRAAGAVTEDLGTEFSIRAYADAPAIRVVVTAGSVAVGREDAAVGTRAVVHAGQSASLAPGSAVAVSTTANAAAALAWTRGELVFDDAPLSAVATELERWYDVKFEVPDAALAARHITVSFAREPLDEVLRVIALSVGARADRAGRTVILRPAGTP